MTKLFNAGNQNLLKLGEEQKGVRGFINLSNVQNYLCRMSSIHQRMTKILILML